MKLVVMTPAKVVCNLKNVASIDLDSIAVGSLHIGAAHPNFITPITGCIVSWRTHEGTRGYCWLRGGVLSVTQGRRIIITTREAQVCTTRAPQGLEPMLVAAAVN